MEQGSPLPRWGQHGGGAGVSSAMAGTWWHWGGGVAGGPVCHSGSTVAEVGQWRIGGPLCYSRGTAVARWQWAGTAMCPRGLLLLQNLRRLRSAN